MAETTIRAVQPTDHDGVMALAPRLLVGVDPSRPVDQVKAAIKGWLETSVSAASAAGRAGWVAVREGEVIGFVSVAEVDHWCGDTDAYVGELMVSQRFERQGVAHSLIATAEAWATERGLGQIRLSTGTANHGALVFYERLGYSPSEVILTRQLSEETSE